MRILKRIILFPVYVLVAIMSTSVKILIKAECWVAGVGFLLLAILSILAIINRQWLQVGVFGLLIVIGAMVMLLSTNLWIWIDLIIEALNSFIGT